MARAEHVAPVVLVSCTSAAKRMLDLLIINRISLLSNQLHFIVNCTTLHLGRVIYRVSYCQGLLLN